MTHHFNVHRGGQNTPHFADNQRNRPADGGRTGMALSREDCRQAGTCGAEAV